MWTEFIAQALRDDKSDTQNLDTKAVLEPLATWPLCNLCTVGMVFVAKKANNTMWLKQSRSLISSHNWKTQPWGMDWSALQIQFFSLSSYLPLLSVIPSLPSQDGCPQQLKAHVSSGTKGHFFNTIKQSSKHYDNGSVNMCSGKYETD